MREMIKGSKLDLLGAVRGPQGEVIHFGVPEREYFALLNGVGLLDLCSRDRLVLTGEDRVRFLHGQVTNDLKRLKPGQGCYAAIANAKGKMEADASIYVLNEELLLDLDPGLGARLKGRFEKFIIADQVEVVDVSPLYGMLSLQGPDSDQVLSNAALFSSSPSELFSHAKATSPEGGEWYLMRRSRGPAIGYDLFVPLQEVEACFDRLLTEVKKLGGELCGTKAAEWARMKAWLPRFGLDMTEANLVSETGLDEAAVNYHKGCYIGQEIINRIKHRGEVAKALRALEFSERLNSLPPTGSPLIKEGKQVGYLTSAANLPGESRTIGMGYVRKEHFNPGSSLLIEQESGPLFLQIIPCPLGMPLWKA